VSQPRFFLIMGVSGSGKSTVGRLLAQRLGWNFYDADDFHPPANVEKMAKGMPLDDADRALWLKILNQLISKDLEEGKSGVLACSALKQQYRQALLAGNPSVELVFLKGSNNLIRSRLADRADHYMQPGMLKSQFDALEEPQDALVVNITSPVEQIVDLICQNTLA